MSTETKRSKRTSTVIQYNRSRQVQMIYSTMYSVSVNGFLGQSMPSTLVWSSIDRDALAP